MIIFFVKQKTAYDMRISDWSSDVCSSDLTVDTAPESRRDSMLAKIDELHAEQAKAVGAGGKYIARHKERGKLTARERIELLVDEGSAFLELMPLAGWGKDLAVGASIVTGIGVVEGVECMIVANDPTVKGGALHPWSVKKNFRAADIAAQNNLPTVNLTESDRKSTRLNSSH